MKFIINAIVVSDTSHRITCGIPFYVRENTTWKRVTILNKTASLIAGFKPIPCFDLEVSECEEPKRGYRMVLKYRLSENDVEKLEPLTSQKDLDSVSLYKIFDFIKISIMHDTISIIISNKWEYAIPFDYHTDHMMMLCCEWHNRTYAFDEYGRRYALIYNIDGIDLNVDEDFKLINVSTITPTQYFTFPEPCKNFKADRKKTKELLKNIREAIPGSKPFILNVKESVSSINSYAYALR